MLEAVEQLSADHAAAATSLGVATEESEAWTRTTNSALEDEVLDLSDSSLIPVELLAEADVDEQARAACRGDFEVRAPRAGMGKGSEAVGTLGCTQQQVVCRVVRRWCRQGTDSVWLFSPQVDRRAGGVIPSSRVTPRQTTPVRKRTSVAGGVASRAPECEPARGGFARCYDI